LDRKRKKKGSNDEWTNPNDPDAQITKMKDGRTHLAHKQEHAVDMDTGAVVAVTVHGGAQGDTSTVEATVAAAEENLDDAREHAGESSTQNECVEEVVSDKGYHSKAVLLALRMEGLRTYISEPRRGRQHWCGQEVERDVVYGNRRRIRGARGQSLMRHRGEIVERSFAHTLETGGMRRTHLRGHQNIAKRMLLHVAGFNLGLLMRKRFGVGKPRCLQGRSAALWAAFLSLFDRIVGWVGLAGAIDAALPSPRCGYPLPTASCWTSGGAYRVLPFTTGC
jgi:transposase